METYKWWHRPIRARFVRPRRELAVGVVTLDPKGLFLSSLDTVFVYFTLFRFISSVTIKYILYYIIYLALNFIWCVCVALFCSVLILVARAWDGDVELEDLLPPRKGQSSPRPRLRQGARKCVVDAARRRPTSDPRACPGHFVAYSAFVRSFFRSRLRRVSNTVGAMFGRGWRAHLSIL